jgi:DNA-binding GntR family transcriptional regulator
MPLGLFALTGTGEGFTEDKIKVETQVLRLERVPTCVLSEGQDPPEGWVALERVRRINHVPTFYEYTWLPAGLAPGLEQIDLRDCSLFSVLTDKYKLRADGGRQRFSAVAAPVPVAAALGVKVGVPLLRLVRTVRLCLKLSTPASTSPQRPLGMLHTNLYVAPGPFILEENIPAPPATAPAATSMPEVRAVQRPGEPA